MKRRTSLVAVLATLLTITMSATALAQPAPPRSRLRLPGLSPVHAASERPLQRRRPRRRRASIGRQPYRVELAPAGAAQTTPGLSLANYAKVHARLHGNRLQVQRLYRFDVTSRSNLELDLRTGSDAAFDLELRRSGGRIIDCACDQSGSQTITATTRPGRYYVDVRSRDFGSGAFTAGAVGPAEVEIDRFDPIAGWQYNRTVKVPISGGYGSFTFTPPMPGQWRATASFLGSRGFSPSASKVARVLAAGPLSEELFRAPLP